MIQHYLSRGKKWNKTTIHSFSGVWNTNSLALAKHPLLLVFCHWSCTSNEAFIRNSPQNHYCNVQLCHCFPVRNFGGKGAAPSLFGAGQVASMQFEQPPWTVLFWLWLLELSGLGRWWCVFLQHNCCSLPSLINFNHPVLVCFLSSLSILDLSPKIAFLEIFTAS